MVFRQGTRPGTNGIEPTIIKQQDHQQPPPPQTKRKDVLQPNNVHPVSTVTSASHATGSILALFGGISTEPVMKGEDLISLLYLTDSLDLTFTAFRSTCQQTEAQPRLSHSGIIRQQSVHLLVVILSLVTVPVPVSQYVVRKSKNHGEAQ